MKLFLKILSYVGLALTIIPSILIMTHGLDLNLYKDLMLIGTLIWIVAAPFWIFEEKKPNDIASID